MSVSALNKIAKRLDDLAFISEETDGKVDSFDLRNLARQVRAQIEMMEKGLVTASGGTPAKSE